MTSGPTKTFDAHFLRAQLETLENEADRLSLALATGPTDPFCDQYGWQGDREAFYHHTHYAHDVCMDRIRDLIVQIRSEEMVRNAVLFVLRARGEAWRLEDPRWFERRTA